MDVGLTWLEVCQDTKVVRSFIEPGKWNHLHCTGNTTDNCTVYCYYLGLSGNCDSFVSMSLLCVSSESKTGC